MSGPDPRGGLPGSPEHAYFRAVEAVFLDERGAPLSLGADDWHLSREWHDRGMPLEWLEDTLREIFADRRERGTADHVLSLRTLRRSVEAAWERHRKLQAPADVPDIPEIDVEARLAKLAAALPASLSARGAWRARIVKLEGSAEAIEERLLALDRELLANASADLDSASRSALEAKLENARRALAGRLPSSALAEAGERLRERLVRETLGLPTLSLFSPDAA